MDEIKITADEARRIFRVIELLHEYIAMTPGINVIKGKIGQQVITQEKKPGEK